MAKDIEQLSIKIEADAHNAYSELDRLIKQVDGLSRAMQGFDGTKMINGLNGIANATRSIRTTDVSQQMTRMSSSMSNYQRSASRSATTTRDFGTSFATLNRTFNSIYSGLSRVTTRINSYIFRSDRASKSTKNFAQTVGLLYARFFLLMRAVRLIGKMVKSSMSYIEVMNYFGKSFGAVAQNAVGEWEQAGYDSADAYYKSFQTRAKEVTADMSGFLPNEKGLLTPTGQKSLGLNPQDLIQYQTQFAQMANSMGATSEQALKLSEVLTKIGADLSSVKNMDFNDVWGDMASGLVGMSRTLDKYGVNIRNANMEAKLHELGINATVSSLSQADKALLRTIILLDASRYAWGDLADTLNTPANQFRTLKNNIKLLGQTIGQILLPIVAKILPYINALVIALQRLFIWLAKVFNIDLSGLMSKQAGGDNSPISDLLDDSEDLGDNLKNDTDQAKKLKRQLQGFDALNNLTSNDKDGENTDLSALASGLLNDAFLDAVNDYLKAWQDAFDRMEDRAKAIADKIERFFKNLVAPIRRAWEKVGKDVIRAWKRVFSEVGKFAESFRISFWRMWGEKKTQDIFEGIFGITADIGDIIANLIRNFRSAWDENLNGYHILAAIRDIVLTIVDHFHQGTSAIKDWSENLNFEPLLRKFAEFLSAMNEVIDHLMDVMVDFLNVVLLPLAKWTLEEGLPKLLQVFIDFKNKVDWEGLKAKLLNLWEHLEPFAERVGEGLILFIEDISMALADFLNSETFEHFLDKLIDWMDNTSARDVANTLENIAKAIVALQAAFLAFGALTAVTGVITTISNFLKLFGTGGLLAGAAGTITETSEALTGLSGALFSLGFLGTVEMGDAHFDRIGNANKMGQLTKQYKEGKVSADEYAKTVEKIFSKTKDSYDVYSQADSLKRYYKDGWINAEAYYKSLEKIYNLNKELSNSGLAYKVFGWEDHSLDEQLEEARLIYEHEGKIASESFQTGLNSNGDVGANFVNNVSNQINASSETLNKSGNQAGHNLTEGYNTGVAEILDSSSKIGQQAANNFASEKNLNQFKVSGEKCADTVNKGFTSKEVEMINTSLIIATKTAKALNSKTTDAQTAGANMGTGFSNGLKSKLPALIALSGAIAGQVVNKFKQSWSIHSPSRVMDEMGVYFMQGLQNGIESMYTPIKNSVSDFSTDLIDAPSFENELSFQGASANVSSSQTYNLESGTTNALLMRQNELLEMILDKDTGISESAIFKSVQNSANSYYKMTGNKAFT